MRKLAWNDRNALRIWIGGFLACAILVILCIAYVDRPLASFVDSHFRNTFGWVALDRALEPLKIVALTALLFLFWAGCTTASGHHLPRWGAKALVCSWAVTWGLATEFVLKQIFGRAWPDPTYTQHHLYGFGFLHASENWRSFPSGTAIASTALATTLAHLFPRFRGLISTVAALVCIAVVAGNYHWLSDSIAGAFLGISIGWMSIALTDFTPETTRSKAYNPSRLDKNGPRAA